MVVKKMDNETERLMRDGQAAAKRGDRAMARALLTQLLERDPHNEQAWMWLSGAVSDPEEQQTCLENALIINPQNDKARKGLVVVSKKTGILPRVPDLPGETAATPEPAQPAPAANASQVMGRVKDEAPAKTPAASGASGAVPRTSPLPQAGAAPPREKPAGASDFSLPNPASGHLQPWQQPAAGPAAPAAPGTRKLGADVESAKGASSGAEAGAGAAPFDVAPFQVPQDPGQATYRGGPPSSGLPPDLSNAVPEWVREVVRASGPLSPEDLPPELAAESAAAGTSHGTHESQPQAHKPHDVAAAPGEPKGQAEQPHPVAAPAPAVPMPDLSVWFDNSAGGVEAGLAPVAVGEWAAVGMGGSTAGSHANETANPAFPDSFANIQPQPAGPHADPFANIQPQPAGAHADPFGGNQPGANPHNSGPFGPNAGFDMGALGPYGATDLPLPTELPGGHHHGEPAAQNQPWYLQSQEGTHSTPNLTADAIPDAPGFGAAPPPKVSGPLPTIECPNCRQQVPETMLNCPECSYSFFVHCPHCHELVDTSEARLGVTENCPYCNSPINKMELGLINAQGITSLRADPVESSLSWTGVGLKLPKRGFRLTFAWLADLFALVVIILMVWVLAQLPVWFNWTHLYN